MQLSRSRRSAFTLAAAVSVAIAGASLATAAPTTAPDGDRTGQVIVEEVTIPVAGQDPVVAWLVRPTKPGKHSAAGVLWLHWLGEIHGDRSEYLSEAIDLANEGTVSLLPQGTFPWVGDPIGDETDVAAVEAQLAAYQASLDALLDRRAVDTDRVAVVGHDYGAMYGSLLAEQDHRVSTMVMAAPDATWGNWFATFWLGLEGEEAAAYAALFAGLDPVDNSDRLGEDVLIQWAGDDFFIPVEVRDAFAAAAPDAQVVLYPGVDHEFTTKAQIDRLAFLRTELGLS